MSEAAEPLPRLASDLDADVYLLRCVARMDDGNDAPLRASASRLARAAAGAPRDARLRAQLGGALLRLGRADAAALALDRALRLDPSLPEARRRKGEQLLLAGRPREAAAELRAAAAADPRCPTARFLLGAACAADGRREEAAAELRRASKLGSRAGAALLGWIEFLETEGRRGGAALESAVRSQAPGEGWAHALRGLALRRLGRTREALADLDRSLERCLSPWVLAQRADLLEQLCRMEDALRDLDLAAELKPAEPAFRAQRGRLLHFRKRYADSVADFTAALRGSPRDPRLLEWRAEGRWAQGRLDQAAADFQRAARLDGDNGWYALRALQLEGLLGRAVERRLEPWLEGPEACRALLVRGILRLRAGRPRDALRDLEAAKERAATSNPELLPRLALYGAAARGSAILDLKGAPMARRTDKARPARLYLIGFGIDYPRQTTLEVIEALSHCDVVFSNLPGKAAAEFLWTLAKSVRPLSYEGQGDEEKWTELVMSEMRPGRTVGFVTRGHPLLSGNLAYQMIQRCEAKGFAHRSFAAISSVDMLLAATGTVLGQETWGLQSFDARAVVEEDSAVRTDLPLILYMGIPVSHEAPDFRATTSRFVALLCGALKRFYPDGHFAHAYGPRYDDTRLRKIPLSKLEEELARTEPSLLSSLILFFPPVRDGQVEGPRFAEAVGMSRQRALQADRDAAAARPRAE